MKLTYRLATLAALIATPLPAFAATINAIMYKNPQCSCCESYARYLEHNGFKVDIKPVNNLSQISSDAGDHAVEGGEPTGCGCVRCQNRPPRRPPPWPPSRNGMVP